MYLKDLAHSSFVSSETKLSSNQITNLQRIWERSVGAPVASAVTVSGSVLYFGDWTGYFHAVNAQTGTELWRTFVGKAPNPELPDCMPGIGVTSGDRSGGHRLCRWRRFGRVRAGPIYWKSNLARLARRSGQWFVFVVVDRVLSKHVVYRRIVSGRLSGRARRRGPHRS